MLLGNVFVKTNHFLLIFDRIGGFSVCRGLSRSEFDRINAPWTPAEIRNRIIGISMEKRQLS